MITIFKLFEMTDSIANELKIGDIIVCISKYSNGIKYGYKYKIHNKNGFMVSVKPYNKNSVVKIKGHKDRDRYFYIKNFMTEYEWNSKKYNL